ncbi:MAG: cytochrome P450 [Cyanobacteria bacterium J06621_11]
MTKSTLVKKVLKGHKKQLKLSQKLAKLGYNTTLGKALRLKAYYSDALILLKAWKDFLVIRKKHIGNQYFAVDHAIMNTDHARVKTLMNTEPQLRGNDLGIIRILAPSYLLNHPLSLGTNGAAHTGLRAVFQQALPDPFEEVTQLSQYVEQFLQTATQKGTLHVGNDLPDFMLKTLHQTVFQFSPLKEELSGSRAYIKGLPLASLPNFISQYLLWFKTGPCIRHRKRMVRLYQSATNWPQYMDAAADYDLPPESIANGLFDMIHIAGTAGTSALMGSVIGVLCSGKVSASEANQKAEKIIDDELREKAIAEINTIWANKTQLDAEALHQATTLHKVILETARLYPPVRFVSQLTQSEGTVEIGTAETGISKCPFQQGTRLLGSIFTANRDEDRYEKPDDFSIDRDFSDLLSWNGDGHERVCPGRSLSIELVKIFCLHLFKHYQWEAPAEVKWDFEKVTAVTPNDLVLQGFSGKVNEQEDIQEEKNTQEEASLSAQPVRSHTRSKCLSQLSK